MNHLIFRHTFGNCNLVPLIAKSYIETKPTPENKKKSNNTKTPPKARTHTAIADR